MGFIFLLAETSSITARSEDGGSGGSSAVVSLHCNAVLWLRLMEENIEWTNPIDVKAPKFQCFLCCVQVWYSICYVTFPRSQIMQAAGFEHPVG